MPSAITSHQPIITYQLWEFSLELQKIQKMGSPPTSTIQYPRCLISTYWDRTPFAPGISLDNILQTGLTMKSIKQQMSHVSTAAPDKQLQSECHKLCDEFPDLFKNKLGCLKDFELEVKFKPNAKLVFCKARQVPFAIREDLSKGYDGGIA